MIEVKGHKALVVGAGQSAKYKIRALAEFGADVTVVAPVISADVVKQGKDVKIERRVYRPGETKGYEIVVAATDNSAVNKQVAHDAARFGAICTVADDPLRGGFIFPAIIKKDNYSVAISTDGKSPLLAKRLKETIEESLPEKADDMVALLGNARKGITDTPGTFEEHRKRLADLAESEEAAEEVKEETPEEKSKRISSSEGEVIRVGSRESRLAQAQTDSVISLLTAKGYRCEKVLFKTTGDKMLDRPLQEFGGKAVFVTEIEDALLNGDIDIAVHSAKDMPAEIADTLTIAACLPREDARDVLVTRKGTDKRNIEIIGTSSLRRRVQIERFLTGGEIRVLRGNVPTRIQKLKDGEFDAIILAAAGLNRLKLMDDEELEYEYIEPEKSLPAAGQGIIAIESRNTGRAHDAATLLNDSSAMTSLTAEREFMKVIGAGCHEAVAAYSVLNAGKILMKVMKYIGNKCVYFAGSQDSDKGVELAGVLGGKINDASKPVK